MLHLLDDKTAHHLIQTVCFIKGEAEEQAYPSWLENVILKFLHSKQHDGHFSNQESVKGKDSF
jgi:hypothetical protein